MVYFVYLYIHKLKFIYSEKATKFCEIFTLLLTTVNTVNSKVKISQNFVIFSEYMNFNKCPICFGKRFQSPLVFKFSRRLSLKTKRNEICLCALGTIHILRKHKLGLLGPSSPLRKYVVCTENNQKSQFSNFPLPYKCLRNI